ncbi:hypothetical protein [Rhodopirellula europaea]|jgi:hypothetical protein|nr:hypothetical protein [Rhodopirellula europaea]MCR9211543.1 hypothetical protein [bacterium]
MNASRIALICAVACLAVGGCSSDSMQQPLAGRYYQGDGLGYNLDLKLHENGTFTCDWTGCLGHYGKTTGTWISSNDQIDLTADTALGMFEDDPISDLIIANVGGERRLVFESDADLMGDADMLVAFSFGPYPD